MIHSCVEGEGRQQLPALAAGGGLPQQEGGGHSPGSGVDLLPTLVVKWGRDQWQRKDSVQKCMTERGNSEEPDDDHHHV